MVSQRCFFLEPREKSHGQVDEATLPLCVMVRKLHAFPSEKGKKHQFCLPSVGNSSARISKVGLEKSTPTHPEGFQGGNRRISLKKAL